MPLTKKQELEAAQARIASGKPGINDEKNVAYARKIGLLPTGATPTVNLNQPTLANTMGTEPTPTKIEDLKTLARQVAELSYKKSGGAMRGISLAKQAGLTALTPESANIAIKMGTVGVKGDITDIFQRTLNSITKQETNRKEGSDWLVQLMTDLPEFYNSGQITGAEFEYLNQVGAPPTSLVAKLAQWKVQHPEAERDIVIGLATKYWDAGILPTDSLAVATGKANKSPMHLKEMESGGGGGTYTGDLTDQSIDQNYITLDEETGEYVVNGEAIQAFVATKDQRGVYEKANARADAKNMEIITNATAEKQAKEAQQQQQKQINQAPGYEQILGIPGKIGGLVGKAFTASQEKLNKSINWFLFGNK